MFKIFGAINAWSSLAIGMAEAKQDELSEHAEQHKLIKRMQLELEQLKLEAKLYQAEAEKHTAVAEARPEPEPDYMDEEEFFGTIV